MERDQKKRSRAVDGASGGGQRKKERETKGKDAVQTDAVVVPPPTDDEMDEFIAILRRMRETAKYFEIKGNGGGKLLDPSTREVEERKVGVRKRNDVALLDLNTVPNEGE